MRKDMTEPYHFFETGNFVRIRPAFRGPNDKPDDIYIITNINDLTQRAYIRPVKSTLPLVPEELVGMNMLEHVWNFDPSTI